GGGRAVPTGAAAAGRAGRRRLEPLRPGAPRGAEVRRDGDRSRRRVPAPDAPEGSRDRDGARTKPVGQRRAPAGGAVAGAAGGALPGAPGRRHRRQPNGRRRGGRQLRRHPRARRSGSHRRLRGRGVLGGEPDAPRQSRPAGERAGARVRGDRSAAGIRGDPSRGRRRRPARVPESVIVRLPNWLGDTVMAVPAVRALRQALDGGRLLLAGPWAAVLGGQALADVLVTYPRSWSGRLSTADSVRSFGGDTALLLPTSFEAAASALYWGARRRIGFAVGGP